MPRCERCNNSVHSYDLRCVRGEGGKTEVVCATCRKPEEVIAPHPEDRQIAAVSLHQYETAEGKKDYRLKAEVSHKGFEVNYQVNFEDARRFFKENAKKKAELKAV